MLRTCTKSKLFFLILLAGIFLQTFDICSDCDEEPHAPLSACQSCVQCGPSQGAMPLSQLAVKLPHSNHLTTVFYSDEIFRHQNPFLDSLYRPPIA